MAGQIMGLSKREKQKVTNQEFLNRIELDFQDWRRKKGRPNNTKAMLEFLLCHNFVEQTIINRWMTLNEYAAQIEITKSAKNPRGVKQWAIWACEEILPLGETQIKANIRNHATYFKENRRFFP